jgi:hypothetical protein
MSLVVPVIYERWVTAQDENVCRRCGPLHGQMFVQGSGPVPPLHRFCRCQRVYAGMVEPLPISMPEPPAAPDVPLPVWPGEPKERPPDDEDRDWWPPVIREEP